MEILVKDAALKKDLEEIGEVFRANYPEDYETFIKFVIEESQKLIKPSGMSAEGHYMNFMKIPTAHAHSDGAAISLYEFIKIEMRRRYGIPDFFADRKNYHLLCKVWQDAYVKKTLSDHSSLFITKEQL